MDNSSQFVKTGFGKQFSFGLPGAEDAVSQERVQVAAGDRSGAADEHEAVYLSSQRIPHVSERSPNLIKAGCQTACQRTYSQIHLQWVCVYDKHLTRTRVSH